MALNQPIVLTCSISHVKLHWGLLRSELEKVLPIQGRPYRVESDTFSGVTLEVSSDRYPGVYGLRTRGGNARVVPLLANEYGDFKYWMSIYQAWNAARAVSQDLEYKTTSL